MLAQFTLPTHVCALCTPGIQRLVMQVIVAECKLSLSPGFELRRRRWVVKVARTSRTVRDDAVFANLLCGQRYSSIWQLATIHNGWLLCPASC